MKGVLHKCVTRRRFEGRPHYPPPPPPLLAFRVTEAPAFTYTGVDYAGPLFIKSVNSSGESKVWICLYTCCIVRAIHLEVVPDLTTQSFIRCFKRFSARRGFPTELTMGLPSRLLPRCCRTLSSILELNDSYHESSGCSTWKELHGGEEFLSGW